MERKINDGQTLQILELLKGMDEKSKFNCLCYFESLLGPSTEQEQFLSSQAKAY